MPSSTSLRNMGSSRYLLSKNDSTTSLLSVSEHRPIHVFVFAHPDDESMFFLPTVRWLVDKGETVWFLCLTTGNYDGLGTIREIELQKAGKLLGAANVIVRNDDPSNKTSILDHPTKRHDKVAVARAIRESLSSKRNRRESIHNHHRFVLITFDEKGVSGHVNHTDVYHGVVHLMEEEEETMVFSRRLARGKGKTQKEEHDDSLMLLEAWYLESERNILAKYIPLLSWMILLLSYFSANLISTKATTMNDERIYRMHNPRLNWMAMATHHSQFVWYRRLFVIFSCYTYKNKMTCYRN